MNKNFEEYLYGTLNKLKNNTIKEAMEYCLEGGQRFRPQIIFAITKGFGIDEKEAYGVASALEYIQTYSLIHDDLPGMDNDDMRRGKPSCHKKFGEDIAILTGDSLLTHSFSCITEADYNDSVKVKMIDALCKYSGLFGMIYGQLLDVTAKGEITAEELFEIQDNKTSGLFKFACLAPMFIAGNDKYEYFEKLGSMLGVVFQNQDDLFDIIKSEKETGKSNSDVRNDKITALKFKTVEELKEHIDNEFKELREYLKDAPFDTQYILEIIDRMANR
ncbi:MAG: polyprenyl synthetase family protein [Erysipelotrichaceae bacterium]|nr:polyprenyl synthetase family protein [Erysipelotrichaceae bacterium]